jgi:tryptophanase
MEKQHFHALQLMKLNIDHKVYLNDDIDYFIEAGKWMQDIISISCLADRH